MEQNTQRKGILEENFVSPPRVIVKFAEGKAPPYQSQPEGYDSLGDYIQKNDIGAWVDLSEKFPGVSVQLVFVSVDPETIDNLVKKAQEADSSYQDPNFLSYFAVAYDELPEDASYEELYENMLQIREELSSWGSVEWAYIQHGLGPLPAVPSVLQNDELDNQEYLNPASLGGVSAKYAWDYWLGQGYPDGPGSGIDFIDIERGWDLEHQDLDVPLIPLITGINKESKMHGTSTLGVVVGRDNAVGIVGLAYRANATVISVYPDAASVNPDHSDSIMAALSRLTYGDVLLIEEQAVGDAIKIDVTDPETKVVTPVPFRKLWPLETIVETNPNANSSTLIWEVIYLGTTLGIIIVEPAGNGVMPVNSFDSIPPGTPGNDLSDFIDSAGKHILDRDPNSPHNGEFKDSRAIIVGAATKGELAESYEHYRTLQTSTAPFAVPSNYGKRIDCFGWGHAVRTSGGGPDNSPTHDSYLYFDGTSSASAIIAGVALVIQSFAIKKTGFRLGPIQMRSLLSDSRFGTEVYGPDLGDPVEGYLPDLKKILDNYFNVPHEDIFIRDHPNDVGDTNTGLLFASPDMIVKNSSTSTSNYITNPNLDDSDPNITGASAYIYVRAFNRGNATANDVKVSLYYSEPTTLLTPAAWNLIVKDYAPPPSPGGISIPGKSGGTNGVSVIEIPWSTVPNPGDYCFIGLVGNVNDPLVDPKDPQVVNFYNDLNNFRKFINRNNNVAQKSIHVEQISNASAGTTGPGITGAGISPAEAGDSVKLPFFVAGTTDRDRLMELEIVARLPEGARVWLEGRDDFLFALHGKTAPNVEPDQKKGTARILINPYGPYRLNETVFPKDLRERLALVVDLPKERRNQAYELYARQLYQGEEVGRVTWQLTPPDLIRVDGLTPVERRCLRLGWLLVGLLALFILVAGLHPFTGYLAEIIVGLGAVLAGFNWYRACRPDKSTILKEIAMGLGIGFVLLAWGMLAGLI